MGILSRGALWRHRSAKPFPLPTRRCIGNAARSNGEEARHVAIRETIYRLAQKHLNVASTAAEPDKALHAILLAKHDPAVCKFLLEVMDACNRQIPDRALNELATMQDLVGFMLQPVAAAPPPKGKPRDELFKECPQLPPNVTILDYVKKRTARM